VGAVVNTEMNFLVPKTKDGDFLEQLSNFSLLKKTVLAGGC